jgi:hypothetical protein
MAHRLRILSQNIAELIIFRSQESASDISASSVPRKRGRFPKTTCPARAPRTNLDQEGAQVLASLGVCTRAHYGLCATAGSMWSVRSTQRL